MAVKMRNEDTHRDVATSRAAPDGAASDVTRYSRRQAMGRMSVFATAGAAAWVVPEILTAQPASGATLSAPVTGASTFNPATFEPATAAPPAKSPATKPTSLASTGLDLRSETEIGAALIAGGWALHHWASRLSPPHVGSPGNPSA
jgi:hypothetical protein